MAQTPSSARDLHDEQIMRNVHIFTGKSKDITDEGFVEDNVSGFDLFELEQLTLHVDTEPTLQCVNFTVQSALSTSAVQFQLDPVPTALPSLFDPVSTALQSHIEPVPTDLWFQLDPVPAFAVPARPTVSYSNGLPGYDKVCAVKFSTFLNA